MEQTKNNIGIAYIQGIHPDSYRHKQVAIILRVVMYTPFNLEERPCFEIMYLSDFDIDYVPVSSITGTYPEYRILNESDARAEDLFAQIQQCDLEANLLFERIQNMYAAVDQISTIQEFIVRIAPNTEYPHKEAEELFYKLDRNFDIAVIKQTFLRLKGVESADRSIK